MSCTTFPDVTMSANVSSTGPWFSTGSTRLWFLSAIRRQRPPGVAGLLPDPSSGRNMGQPPFASLGQAIAWLDGHIDLESTTPSRRALPTIDRMRELVAVLDEPQQAFPCIHLTGTNGKGSTAIIATSL